MLSREKKPGSRTSVRAVCSSSSTGEDWSFADPLHPPRGATLDLVPGLAAGDHTRPDPCLVFLSASPSGRCSSVSLQTATGCCKNLTPTVVLGQPREAEDFVNTLRQQMMNALDSFNRALPRLSPT